MPDIAPVMRTLGEYSSEPSQPPPPKTQEKSWIAMVGWSMRGVRSVIAGLVWCVACSNPSTGRETGAPPNPQPSVTQTKLTVTVTMTAVTLADDCGGIPPARPPAHVASDAAKDETKDAAKAKRKADQGCEQSSMQLSLVAAGEGAALPVRVKLAELFDEAGTKLGNLAVSSPTAWSEAVGAYQPWDQMIAATQTLAVSYVLGRPDWKSVAQRANQVYVLKAVISVGTGDQTVQHDVTTPTILPPNVKT